jgi:hypothetical protein
MATAPVSIQLDFDTFSAIRTATVLFEHAVNTARANGQMRYADELEMLSAQLVRVMTEMNQAWRTAHPEGSP